jgi:hypothetical protein
MSVESPQRRLPDPELLKFALQSSRGDPYDTKREFTYPSDSALAIG